MGADDRCLIPVADALQTAITIRPAVTRRSTGRRSAPNKDEFAAELARLSELFCGAARERLRP
jgi:hypothetical protein